MRALVLGAGGSARAAVWALREAGAARCRSGTGLPSARRRWRTISVRRAVTRPAPADLLVNCTSVGLEQAEDELGALELTAARVGDYVVVADLVYRSRTTQLLSAAREHGARTIDGLEILVAQGALSFELWTGRSAPLDVMRAAARERAHAPPSRNRAAITAGLQLSSIDGRCGATVLTPGVDGPDYGH